jgi:pimeloyl-ACP methyl ester carboxylesterase
MISRKAARGATRLTFDTVEAVTRIVESMHETIARHPLPLKKTPDEPTGAHGLIASTIYRIIRGVNHTLRESTDTLFGLLPESPTAGPLAPEQIRALGVLNGAVGDHLEATGNTLQIPMTLTSGGCELVLERDALREALPDARGHLVVLVHGLCLTELCWQHEDGGDLAQHLSREMPVTTLHLRYNTGRHISRNGQELAALLDEIDALWPVALESLTLIGHSMGGLVIRSACWYADARGSAVLSKLKHVVYLGTPHHGSMIERAGHAFDLAIRKYPYIRPFAVGRHRSAGIKDLHHGDLLDEDWQEHHPEQPRSDRRRPVPLLPQVDHYLVAAVVGDSEAHPLSALAGDLLVRSDSAVGVHKEAHKRLPVPDSHCRVFCEKHHFDLLTDTRVHQQIVEWLAGAAR